MECSFPVCKGKCFTDGNQRGIDYTYDVNGNLTRDKNKGITDIAYNHLNLPEAVIFEPEGQLASNTIEYIYTAVGTKIEKKVTRNQNNSTQQITTTQYAMGMVYKDGELEYFSQPEGYVQPAASGSGYDYVYQYKDHLGNIRLSYQDKNGNGTIDPSTEIVEENNYYPFGLQHKGYNNVVNGSENNYQTYNGQEDSKALGHNVVEMTFRQYDPAIGRFNGVDRFAELMPSITPYRFGFNNPILWSDPSGLIERSVLMDMYNRSGSGKTTWTNDGYPGFETDDGGFVGYTSDDTSWNRSPGDPTNLPAVTVTYGDENSYRRAAKEIEQNIYQTKWYKDHVDLLGFGISAVGNVSSGVKLGLTYSVTSNFKSNSNLWDFQKLSKSQQAWRINAELGVAGNARFGKYGLKALKISKVAGPVATAIGVGYSGYKIYNGTATTIDYVDAGVGVASLGAAIFLASNPVGWAIGTGAGVYFAGRFIYDLIEESND